MIELLVAYLLFEGGASWEWWALYAAMLLMRIGHAWQQLKKEEEEGLLIKKIINAEVISKDISSNH